MKESKKVAVYVDYSLANIIEYIHTASMLKTIESGSMSDEMRKKIQRGETYKLSIKQHEYYKELKNCLLHYECILLFGPTNAKIQFSNILKKNNKDLINKVILKNSEELSHDEQLEFVNEFFYIS
ncbi:hypothetical protein [Flavobacterium sp.]|uniref:hypothetical protein n=1 Tax=Flavobacterium sp. TaxID=239 RepID=UPI002FDC8209